MSIQTTYTGNDLQLSMTGATDFGAALRLFRDERTLSLRELSQLSGVDHAYIHRLESGDKTAPSAEVMEKLVRGLKLSPHKRKLLEWLAGGAVVEPLLFGIAVDQIEDLAVIKVAATMSFRGARPVNRDEWLTKLAQIKELIGDVGG